MCNGSRNAHLARKGNKPENTAINGEICEANGRRAFSEHRR